MSEATLAAWHGPVQKQSETVRGGSDPALDPVIRSIVQRHQSLVADLAALQDAIQRLLQRRPAATARTTQVPTVRSQEIAAVRARARAARTNRRPWARLSVVAMLMGLAIGGILYIATATESIGAPFASGDSGPVAGTLPVSTAGDAVIDSPATGAISLDTAEARNPSIGADQRSAAADAVMETGTNPATILVAIQPGDTIAKLAEQYNTTAQAIAEINALSDPNLVFVGQSLLIVPGAQ